MNTSIYPWQFDAWQRMQAFRSCWPHALLLHGAAGIGKFDFACHLAASLVCETPLNDGQPCHGCIACHWLAHRTHPDVCFICPENRASPGNNRAITSIVPIAEKTRVYSSEIKIEQIRALIDFCSLSAHRNGLRAAVLAPAESLNATAANALLKTLEEPPAGVVFLLVCARLDQLPATIISRCQRWPMHIPARAEALAWLNTQNVNNAEDALAAAGGAPLGARAFAQDQYACERHFVVNQLAAGRQCDAFSCGEKLQKVPIPNVLGWLQRWLYDLFAQCLAKRLRYHPGHARALVHCAKQLNTLQLARYIQYINMRRAIEHHPLNARLMFEVIFSEYRELFSY